jgi:tight adherence protein C
MTIERMLHDPDTLSLLCGAGAFGVVVLIWLALIDKDPLPERLKNITQHKRDLRDAERRRNAAAARPAKTSRAAMIRRIVLKLKLEQGRKLNELRLKLARAGYRARDAMFLYLFLKLAMPVGGAFGMFFFVFVLHMYHGKPVIGFLMVAFAGIFGLMLPDIFLKNQSQKRVQLLRKAMPDALDLMVICAEAGLSLDSSLDRVSREIGPSSPELAEEVGLTAVELSFLPDRSKALQNLADRVPLPGVLALTNTLIQTEKYGTPLAQSLRVLSGEMRDDRIMQAETKAAKLPATLTIPMILFILPPLFVVLIGPAALKVMGVASGIH